MALTRLQARDGYLIGSIALFLDRNLKQPYDAEVATLTFPTPLTIDRGKPDDKGLTLTVPRIMIDTISGTESKRAYELGSNTLWRHMNLVFYCYPSTVNSDSDFEASDLLKTYMRDTFGTSFIRIVDYSNPLCTATNILFCSDVAEVVRVQDPVDRKLPSLLAEEAHRFDMHVSIRYPVSESDAT